MLRQLSQAPFKLSWNSTAGRGGEALSTSHKVVPIFHLGAPHVLYLFFPDRVGESPKLKRSPIRAGTHFLVRITVAQELGHKSLLWLFHGPGVCPSELKFYVTHSEGWGLRDDPSCMRGKESILDTCICVVMSVYISICVFFLKCICFPYFLVSLCR